jgi:hypothetical protein
MKEKAAINLAKAKIEKEKTEIDLDNARIDLRKRKLEMDLLEVQAMERRQSAVGRLGFAELTMPTAAVASLPKPMLQLTSNPIPTRPRRTSCTNVSPAAVRHQNRNNLTF